VENVLFIANRFYPSSKVGALRPTKFAKFLPEFGWQPIILTASQGQGTLLFNNAVYRLPALNSNRIYAWGRQAFPQSKRLSSASVKSKAGDATLSGARSAIFNRWLFIPDVHIFWALRAAQFGLQLAKANDVRAIFSTAPPYSSHLAAWIIARRLGLPWVADFRDPWLTNSEINYPTPVHRWLNSRLEAIIIRTADRVSNVSPQTQEDFIVRYPDKSKASFLTIYNGFDADDFVGIKRGRLPQKRLRILHNGTFYGTKNPISFLSALEKLRDDELLNDIEICFVGASKKALQPLIDTLGLSPYVTILGYMPHQTSLQYLLDADLLLLISGAARKRIPAKLYEYLATGKPILALGLPQSATAHLIDASRSGIFADYSSPTEIADGLMKLINCLRRGNAPSAQKEFVAKFEYRVLTKQMAQCLNRISSY